MTITTLRSQINASTYAPHTGGNQMLVLSVRASAKLAWTQFDLSSYTEGVKLTFRYTAWNSSKVADIKGIAGSSIAFQKQNGADWDPIIPVGQTTADILPLLTGEYITLEYDFAPGVYRIYYDAPGATGTSNTNLAVVMDDIVIYK
jgi:hypothetical protein